VAVFEHEVVAADNGLVLLMWVGLSASTDWVRNVLGVASVAQIDIDKVCCLQNERFAHKNKTFCLCFFEFAWPKYEIGCLVISWSLSLT